nr:unnamed protein product [Ipomoea batatas]GMC65006.1 unnamed protein product [Ipomoea batatas]GMD25744.1 unnamed protein product [Ipomoea batatas]
MRPKTVAAKNLERGFVQEPNDEPKAGREECVAQQDLWDEDEEKARIFVEGNHVFVCGDKATVGEGGDSCKDRKGCELNGFVFEHIPSHDVKHSPPRNIKKVMKISWRLENTSISTVDMLDTVAEETAVKNTSRSFSLNELVGGLGFETFNAKNPTRERTRK